MIKNLLLTILLFLVLSQVAAAENAPIKIGWIGPLTGNAAVLGKDSAEAMQMIFDQANAAGGVNGRQLKLIVEDDQYQTSKTVSAYNKLVHSDGVNTIVVITYGGLFAIAPHAQKDGVLLVDPLDCNEDVAALPVNTICIAQMAEQLGYLNAEHATEHAALPTAIIYFANDPFMGTLAKSTKKKFETLGKSVAIMEGYESQTADFRSLLVRAKQKDVKSIFFYGYDELGVGMKQARDIGIDAQFYATVTMTSPGYLASAKGAADGTIVSVWTAPKTNEFNQFISKFESRAGRKPTLEISTIPSVDVANILLDYLRKSDQTEIDVPELREHFYALRDYRGLSGNISVDEDGATRSLPVKTYIFQDGKLKELS